MKPFLSAIDERGSWRTWTALILALPVGLGAGFALSHAGFGLFPAWIFLTLMCPTVLCFIASSRYLFVAMLPVLLMMGMLWIRLLFPPADGRPTYPGELRGVAIVIGFMTVFSLFIAGVIGKGVETKREIDRA